MEDVDEEVRVKAWRNLLEGITAHGDHTGMVDGSGDDVGKIEHRAPKFRNQVEQRDQQIAGAAADVEGDGCWRPHAKSTHARQPPGWSRRRNAVTRVGRTRPRRSIRTHPRMAPKRRSRSSIPKSPSRIRTGGGAVEACIRPSAERKRLAPAVTAAGGSAGTPSTSFDVAAVRPLGAAVTCSPSGSSSSHHRAACFTSAPHLPDRICVPVPRRGGTVLKHERTLSAGPDQPTPRR